VIGVRIRQVTCSIIHPICAIMTAVYGPQEHSRQTAFYPIQHWARECNTERTLLSSSPIPSPSITKPDLSLSVIPAATVPPTSTPAWKKVLDQIVNKPDIDFPYITDVVEVSQKDLQHASQAFDAQGLRYVTLYPVICIFDEDNTALTI
jgi:hypothetical protein